MKRILIIAAVLVAAGLGQAFAQSGTLEKFFLKYKDAEGFETVIVNKDMFDMMQSMNMTSDKDLNIMLEGIESIKILNYEPKGEKGKMIDIYAEVMAIPEIREFKELLSVNESGSKVVFLVKNGDKGKIKEFVMVSAESDEATVIWISGDIDLSMLSRLSKGGFDFNMFNKTEPKREKKNK